MNLQILKDALDCVEVDDNGWTDVVEAVRDVRQRDCRVFFIGNGGSAAISSHMAIDFSNKGKVAAMCFNDGASLTCLSNDYGYENVFDIPLERHARNGDLLFAISSSGQSKSILKPVRWMYALGLSDISVVTLSGFDPENPLRKEGDVNFYVPSDRYWVVENAHMAILHVILENVAA